MDFDPPPCLDQSPSIGQATQTGLLLRSKTKSPDYAPVEQLLQTLKSQKNPTVTKSYHYHTPYYLERMEHWS